jgi:hypothetical protein
MVFWERFSPSKICRTSSREHERTLAHFAPGTCLTTYGKAAEPFTVITTPQFGDRETSTLLSSPIDLAHRTPPTHSPTEVVALGMRKGFGKREVGKKRERGQAGAPVLNGSMVREDVNDHQDGSCISAPFFKPRKCRGDHHVTRTCQGCTGTTLSAGCW